MTEKQFNDMLQVYKNYLFNAVNNSEKKFFSFMIYSLCQVYNHKTELTINRKK